MVVMKSGKMLLELESRVELSSASAIMAIGIASYKQQARKT
jgi:hypothetical protein